MVFPPHMRNSEDRDHMNADAVVVGPPDEGWIVRVVRIVRSFGTF
jgi:hypothetical protein